MICFTRIMSNNFILTILSCCMFSLVVRGEDGYDFVDFQENKTEVLTPESLIQEEPPYHVTERNSFLEWLWGLTGGEEATEAPEPPAVSLDSCSPCSCGKSNVMTRIVGGKPTQINQYPWMTLLMYNKRFYCGGSLIRSNYVLTAAHCVDGFSKDKMSVRLMEYDRYTANETTIIDRRVTRIIRHSKYSDTTFDNDIALLQIETVTIQGILNPVCLPQRGKSFSGQDGLVTGWGVKKEGGQTNPILYEVTVPILSNSDCRSNKYKYGSRRITDNMLCAAVDEGGLDACQGDSGGPLHVVNNSRHDIVGVVSWGEGCARKGYPGVYSRVNRYISWIEKHTQDSCPCSAE